MDKRKILEELINELKNMSDTEFINLCVKDGYKLISYTPGNLGSITIVEDKLEFSYETKVKGSPINNMTYLETYTKYDLEDVA